MHIIKKTLILNFGRFLNVVCFLLGNSPASEFYILTFRNTLSVPSTQAPIKMEQSVPKRRYIKFRRRRIIQKKALNINLVIKDVNGDCISVRINPLFFQQINSPTSTVPCCTVYVFHHFECFWRRHRAGHVQYKASCLSQIDREDIKSKYVIIRILFNYVRKHRCKQKLKMLNSCLLIIRIFCFQGILNFASF